MPIDKADKFTGVAEEVGGRIRAEIAEKEQAAAAAAQEAAAAAEEEHPDPQPPQFVQDAEMVAKTMREIIVSWSEYPGPSPAVDAEHIVIEAAQVLLNATQAVEMWQQQERQFRIQERIMREQAQEMNRTRTGGVIFTPMPPGMH